MNCLLRAAASALDIVESEFMGASANHSGRTALLCSAMGQFLGMDHERILGLTVCAMLHDNGLTESMLSERIRGKADMKAHCEYGQRNVDSLCLETAGDCILFHHERPDGLGPFGKKAGEISLEAEILAIADSIDLEYHLQSLELEDLDYVRGVIMNDTGKRYSEQAGGALLETLDRSMLALLKDASIRRGAAIPKWYAAGEDVIGFARFMARVVDYRSLFTMRHSIQIANGAWLMGIHYGYEFSERLRLYLAASLHDLGKLAVPVKILEKGSSLSGDELWLVREHVFSTWEFLKSIEGFEDFQNVQEWASFHHEKLDGSGYPFGKQAAELDVNSRLLACLDVYQSASEERPSHPGRDHAAAMKILCRMADRGRADAGIVRDIDRVFAAWDGKDLPPPRPEAGPGTGFARYRAGCGNRQRRPSKTGIAGKR